MITVRRGGAFSTLDLRSISSGPVPVDDACA
jgi:hypothetical protein